MGNEHQEIPNAPPPDLSQPTLNQLNELLREFWSEQPRLMEKRISDHAIYASATERMNAEAMRGTPLKSRQTFEQALADAERDKNLFQAEHSRKGGKAPKGDALNGLIRKLVRSSPHITERQLFCLLNREVGQGMITSIDSESHVPGEEGRKIHFVTDDERPKTASLSGLKDRLAHAKAKINSR